MTPRSEPVPVVSVSEALRQLRSELRESMKDADPELKLNVKEVEVELAVESALAENAKGGISLWNVVTVSGGRERSLGQIHTLRLKFEPTVVADDGKPRTLSLSGDEVPDLPTPGSP